MAEPPGFLAIFLRQFRNPLIYALIIAAFLALALREWVDSGFIAIVLLINAVIGGFQELRAERSAAALRSLVASEAKVLRDGGARIVATEELVPGDVVVLESGDKVPADARILAGVGVEANESLLTGESLASVKSADAEVPAESGIGDRPNMLFAGSFLSRGRTTAVVVATGAGTQLGRIATAMQGTGMAVPPLVQRMELFTKKVAIVTVVVSLLLGVVALMRGTPATEAVLLVIAVAVAAIPEGLPIALTVALSIGARRMSQRRVIVRRLVAVEALGSCTYIASDKTGTLTVNELTARQVALPDGDVWDVTGEGTEPRGGIAPGDGREGEGERDPARVRRLALAAAACNDGLYDVREDAVEQHGDAVDVALLVLAYKAGITQQALRSEVPRLAEIPFEAERQYAATLHRAPEGTRLFVKGAGERLLRMCTRMATAKGDVPIDRDALAAQANDLAARGFRVLAIADGDGGAPRATIRDEALHDLTFLGYVTMIDPLRPEAAAAVAACQHAGITVGMVTGDHPKTALAIARELDLAHGENDVVTGAELRSAARGENGADGADFDAVVRRAHVFARVEPDQKLQIVRSLIRQGHFVAVTGDGANDGPALRAANIGVAMGKRGTDVARESAELVLADDNFSSIVGGVEEGRVAYGNVRKVIFLLASTGAATLLFFILTTALDLPLPLLPAQILWLNLVSNGIQDVALAFERAEGGELDRPPRSPREAIFNRRMIERVLLSALVMAGVTTAAFLAFLEAGWEIPAARNGVLLLLVLFGNFQAGNSRSEYQSLTRLALGRNPVLVIGTLVAQLLHVAVMHLPVVSTLLRVEPVTLQTWASLAAAASTLLVADEAYKWFRRRRPI